MLFQLRTLFSLLTFLDSSVTDESGVYTKLYVGYVLIHPVIVLLFYANFVSLFFILIICVVYMPFRVSFSDMTWLCTYTPRHCITVPL